MNRLFATVLLACFVFSMVSALALIALPAAAQPIVAKPADPKGCPPENLQCNSGNYTFEEMISVLPRVAQFILGISGSLALLAFVWGGLMLLISGGSQEKVGQGKNIIKAAVVGLIIVFLSYSIMSYVYSILGLTFNG